MKNKTIVVNYTGRKGGGAVYAFEMTKGLIANGCKVHAIISKDVENIKSWQKLNLDSLILLSTYSNSFNFAINTFNFILFKSYILKKRFTNISIDAVYVPMIQPWTGIINSIFTGKQKIVTVHDPKPHSGSNVLFNYLCKKNAMQADDIIILSESFKQYVEKVYHKNSKNIHVIPHGIFNFYRKIATNYCSIHYDKTKINFLFFGRITKYKGLHVLAEAYRKLSEEYDDITLTIVGNGNFDEYRAEYNDLKDVRIINCWIKDEEVAGFFNGSNIVTVLPYLDATQSGVIPIAMEYESLIIASNTGGLSEQVKDGETGYLFEAGNSTELYKKMKYVTEKYSEQSTMIKAAKKHIRSLSWDKLSNNIIKIIK